MSNAICRVSADILALLLKEQPNGLLLDTRKKIAENNGIFCEENDIKNKSIETSELEMVGKYI